MVTASSLSFGGRKITNASVHKITASTLGGGGSSSKVIMSYTCHKSPTSLVHYDSTNLAKATKAAQIVQHSDVSKDLPDGPPMTDLVDFSHSNATRYSIYS